MEAIKWNNILITEDELKSCALMYAENYWYDKSQYSTPETQMEVFYGQFGETDEDLQNYEGMFTSYLQLCEQYCAEQKIKYYCDDCDNFIEECSC